MSSVGDRIGPYVPQVLQTWVRDEPDTRWRRLDATLVHVDVSGFTALAERLAARGRIGAEELTSVIDGCFSALLEHVYADGGRLLKFGGDALLLLFDGDQHARHAARAAARMRARLPHLRSVATSAGPIRLEMTVGVRSGPTHLFLVGDLHRELVVCGTGATEVVAAESAAEAGEIVLTQGTAAELPAELLGPARGPGVLLLDEPSGADLPIRAVERVDDARLLSLVPVALRDHLRAETTPEHRRVAVGFLEVGGLDHVDEDPAAAWASLDATVRTVQAAAARHGVTLLGSDADEGAIKLILVAGAPTTSGDDAERLLLSARAILDAVPPLPIRLGATVGPVFAGDVGPTYRRTYTVMGDAVNLAARLMHGAGAQQLLVTPSLLEAARSRFVATALAPLQVKGKADPVAVHRVDGVLGRALATHGDPSQLPLVGRDAELQMLLDRVERAKRGRGSVIEITGEAGIGKSRLLSEVVARSHDVRALVGAGELFRAATPYALVATLLRQALGLADDAAPEETEQRLRDIVAAKLAQLTPWVPLLAVPLGLELADTPETAALDDRFRRSRLQMLLSELLEGACPGATLLVVEDLHWADDASIDVLRSLAEVVAKRPWLLCTTRREGGPLVGDGLTSEELRLAPLPPVAVRALGASATDVAPLPEHVLESLTERSGGNPLYLQELVLAAMEIGDVAALPETIESLVTARVDRLPPDRRQALRTLSVLGNSFERELGIALCAHRGIAVEAADGTLGPPDLDGFVRSDGDRLTFEHALLREAAYNSMPFQKRRLLHAQAADVLGARPDDAPGPLSIHAYLAGRYRDAWQASVAAGRSAAEVYANADAARFLQRGLESSRRVRGIPEEERGEVEELLGDVLRRMGDGAGASIAYRAARRHRGDDPVTAGRLRLKHARAQAGRQRFSQALASITRGLSQLEGVDGVHAGRVRAQLSVWYAHFRQEQGKHDDALRWSLRAEAEAEVAGDVDALAHALQLRDWVHAERGEPNLAVYSSRALELYEELGDLPRQAAVLNNLGGLAFWQGRWGDAAGYYRRAQELDERTGDVLGAAFGRNNLAEILADQGRIEEAEQLLREARRTFRAADYTAGVSYVAMNLGRVAARAGRFEEARETLAASIEGSLQVGAASTALEASARLAEVELLAGAPQAALEAADRVLQRTAETDGVAAPEPLLHRVRAAALLLLEDTAAAGEAFEASRRAAEVRDAAYDVAVADYGLAVVAERSGTAWSEAHAHSLAALDKLGVLAVPYPADLRLAAGVPAASEAGEPATRI